MLERFGGYTLSTLEEEDTRILHYLELESFGDRGEEQEKLKELEAEIELRANEGGE